ncbi:putative ATPase/DNA-binding winged helix-turn-helix (wHTH) protein [Bradyrhizobium sp. S3.12.5]|uniref:ATP-binding protein n=1 Tax=Bradyrhizobium sp. S3.12.5 TaxID=3156386 RepID=UPI003397FF36
MPAQGRQLVYATGEWEIDLDRRELRTRGAPVPLGGRAFEIIEVLIKSVGELVTKDELLSRIWPGAAVEENTLQVHISALRKALGPDRGMLKTISGRGYRLLGTWAPRPPGQRPKARSLQPIVSEQLFQTNLPETTSALIGRDAVGQQLRDLLSAYRVVTLTGPGGIGKTRLALEVARDLFPDFGGDCLLVELASLSDPALLPSAVARVLGLRLGEDAASHTVAQLMGSKKLLLTLDNCEHVIEAAAQFTETIVQLCPHVSILATSREVLRIDGEYVYRVPPLDVPPEDQADPGNVLEHSAAQLFVSRATAAQADCLPDRENLAAISAICRRLDGIPLAIEFAAASAATLGLRHVAARLDDRFGLLTSGRRTALPRHQTLRAALDWSYELLTEQEQQVLCRLAVFHGGFSLKAAASVADATNTLPMIEDIVAKLATKSLVQLDGSGPAGRWRMLETIRAYALEKLNGSGEGAHARRLHAEYFRDLFVPVSAGAPSDKVDDVAWDVRDLDNIRGALDWCFSHAGDLAIGVSLTAACVPMWLTLSLVGECRERAERALTCPEIEQALSARLRMQLYIAFGRAFVQSMGAGEQIRSVLSKGLEIATAINDADAELRALWAMWCYLDHNGEHEEALGFAQRFTETARKKADSADLLVGERLIGYTAHYLGDQVKARCHLQRVVDGYIAPSGQRHMIWFQHDQHVVAKVLLARVLCLQGFLDQAMHLARESLEQARASGQTLTLRYVLGWGLCPLSLISGDLEISEEAVAMLVELAVRRGLPFWQTVGRAMEATLAIRRGDFASGSAWLRGVLDAKPGWILRFPDFLGAFAEGLAGSGQFSEALSIVERPLADAEQGEACWYLPEMLRIKGEILLRIGVDEVEAEARFREALDVARQQGALLWELRSATSLARMLRRDRSKEARQILAPVYSRFTEGFETADLRAARATIEMLR